MDEEQLHQARPVCILSLGKALEKMQVHGKGVRVFSHNTLSFRSNLRAIVPSEHVLCAHIEAAVTFYLGVEAARCVQPWSPTRSELFMWPLTSVAETGNKEVNSETCDGIHRGRRRLQHVLWSVRNVLLKKCGSPKGDRLGRICRNWAQTSSQSSAEPLGLFAFAPRLSAGVTGSEAPAGNLLTLLRGPGGQRRCRESDGPGLRHGVSAESCRQAQRVAKGAGQCHSCSEHRNLVSLRCKRSPR